MNSKSVPRCQRNFGQLVQLSSPLSIFVFPNRDGTGSRFEYVDPVTEVAELEVRPSVRDGWVRVLDDHCIHMVCDRNCVAKANTGISR